MHRYHQNEILATVVNEYTDWERPVQHPINIRDETMEALGDAQVVAPLVRTGDFHSVSRPTNSFFYVFDYQTKFGDFPQVRPKNTRHGVDSLCVGAPARIFHSRYAAGGVSAGRATYFLIWAVRICPGLFYAGCARVTFFGSICVHFSVWKCGGGWGLGDVWTTCGCVDSQNEKVLARAIIFSAPRQSFLRLLFHRAPIYMQIGDAMFQFLAPLLRLRLFQWLPTLTDIVSFFCQIEFFSPLTLHLTPFEQNAAAWN